MFMHGIFHTYGTTSLMPRNGISIRTYHCFPNGTFFTFIILIVNRSLNHLYTWHFGQWIGGMRSTVPVDLVLVQLIITGKVSSQGYFLLPPNYDSEGNVFSRICTCMCPFACQLVRAERDGTTVFHIQQQLVLLLARPV